VLALKTVIEHYIHDYNQLLASLLGGKALANAVLLRSMLPSTT